MLDDERDYVEERYNAELCPECGFSPCQFGDTCGQDRTLVTWELATGIVSMLHTLWEWREATVRRAHILDIALRESRELKHCDSK